MCTLLYIATGKISYSKWLVSERNTQLLIYCTINLLRALLHIVFYCTREHSARAFTFTVGKRCAHLRNLQTSALNSREQLRNHSLQMDSLQTIICKKCCTVFVEYLQMAREGTVAAAVGWSQRPISVTINYLTNLTAPEESVDSAKDCKMQSIAQRDKVRYQGTPYGICRSAEKQSTVS